MTEFNPQFQTQDQSYLGYSKPSAEPYSAKAIDTSDKSTGIALTTAAKGLEEGVTLADTTIKSAIKDEISKQSEQAKDSFLAQLDSFKKSASSNPMNANAEASDQDLMPDKEDIPGGVSNALNTMQRIQDAKEQSGKFRTTDLDATLTAILKKARDDHPGYRDYIDEQGSKIIGYNPANKLINDKVAQLNEQRSNAGKQQEYWEKQLVSSGFSKANEVLTQFRQDGDVTKVENFLTKMNIQQQGVKDKLLAFQLSSAKRGNLNETAEDAAQAAANHAATEYFMARGIVTDQGSGPTSDELATGLNKAAADKNPKNADSIRVAGTQLMALEARNTQETMLALKTTKNADGRSIYDTIGPKKAQEIVDNTIGALYGATHKMMADQNMGLVFSTQNAAADIVTNAKLRTLQSPTIGGVATTGAVLNSLMPNMSTGLIEAVNAQYGKGRNDGGPVGVTGVASDLFKLSQEQFRQGIAQTGGSSDGPGGRKVYTLNQALSEQDKAAGNASDIDRAEAAKRVMKLRQALVEKDPKIVDNAISFFYDPSNRGNLSRYMDDYYDNSRGRVVQGRQGAFSDLTAPDITKAVYERSQKGNGTAWVFYKQWAQGETIPTLQNMAKTWAENEKNYADRKSGPFGPAEGIPGSDHHFYYDTDKHQIGVMNIHGEPLDLDRSLRFAPDLFLVRNANVMFKSLSTIAEQEKTDPNTYIFQQMRQAGWKPESLDLQGNSTVVNRIVKSFITAHTPPKPEEKK